MGATVCLRFDPTLPGRGIQVWLDGRKVQDAKKVDVYGNCFVKRDRPSRTLTPSAPPERPPAGLRLSEMDDAKKGEH